MGYVAMPWPRVPSVFSVPGSGFRISSFGFRVTGFGFRVSGFGFWVSNFGFEEGWELRGEGGSKRPISENSFQGFLPKPNFEYFEQRGGGLNFDRVLR